MTDFQSPDGVPGFESLRPIDQAVLMKDYLTLMEDEISRIKALIHDCCRTASQQEDTESDDYRLVVRYASGVSHKPDVSMLATEYPDRYQRLYDEQVKAFRPSLTKTDLGWLFSDLEEADRELAVSQISTEHPVAPQYVLVARGGGQ